MESHIRHSINILENLQEYEEGKILHKKYSEPEYSSALLLIINLVKNNVTKCSICKDEINSVCLDCQQKLFKPLKKW